MRTFARKLMNVAAIAGLLTGLAATPALADRDRHHHKHWKKHHHSRHYRDWDRPRARHYRDYDRDYYYGSRSYYYSPPGVYVHPAPPSFGLSLVFPFHH